MKPDQRIYEAPDGLCLLLVALAMAVPTSVRSQIPDAFNPGAGGNVYGMAVQGDGKVLASGDFLTLGGSTRNGVGRLNADGSLDTIFNPQVGPSADALAVQADGKILAAYSYSRVARFNVDGTRDTTFAQLDVGRGGVNCLAVQPDGKILVGGVFFTLGVSIGRLNADGTRDAAFNAAAYVTPGGLPGAVNSLVQQADGKILVGGWFTVLNGQTRNGLGRLNADGSLDTSFNPDGGGYPLAVQADGKILVGSGRLNADGTRDTTFNPGADGPVNSLAVQADGKILLGGEFTILGGQARNCIGRVNADGTLDTSFNAAADGWVYSLATQVDGKVLVGGMFTSLGGQTRNRIGRLSNTGPATQSLTFDGSTITWLRGGTSPEVWRATFDASTNGTDWISLGDGARIPGGWQLTGVSAPACSALRARGFVTGGWANGSTWFVETTRPAIHVDGFRSGQLGFSIIGSSGQTVVVEGSTNLLDWISLETNTFGSGPWYFSDADSANLPWRFYRARLQ